MILQSTLKTFIFSFSEYILEGIWRASCVINRVRLRELYTGDVVNFIAWHFLFIRCLKTVSLIPASAFPGDAKVKANTRRQSQSVSY